MPVTNDEEFRAWLEGQPRDVRVAIAYRAAMRVLPYAMFLDRTSNADHFALLVLRCNLVCGVFAARPTQRIKTAVATAGASAGAAAGQCDNLAAGAAAYAVDAACSAITVAEEAESVGFPIFAAESAGGATARAALAAGDADFRAYSAAAQAASYGDTDGDLTALALRDIRIPPMIEAALASYSANGHSALKLGEPWTFWAE